MLRKLVSLVLMVPVGIVLVVLSVANRADVTLVLDPFDTQNPALSVNLPFFAYLFVAFILGLLFGGIVVWWRQGRHRAEARFQRAEARRWREKAEANRRQAEAGAALPVPANDRAA